MDELRRIRKERGLSQARLAELANVDKVTIIHIENGKVSPKVDTLEKLAGALGVELADLFPKAQAPLPLEAVQRSGDKTPAQDEPHYTAFEAFGVALASAWIGDVEEWDDKIPDGQWADSRDFARLVQWALEVSGTKAVYQAVAREMGASVRPELEDTMRLLDDAERAATNKVLRAFEPVKTFREFQKIWEASDMDALVGDTEPR